jgi:glucokinase
MDVAIGIDFGGTNVKGVAVSSAGESLAEIEAPAPRPGNGAGQDAVRAVLRRLEATVGRAADAVGLAAPGLPAADGLSIAHMPGRLAGIEGFMWREFLGRSAAIPVLNDAHAALLGEAWIGAAVGERNVVLLTLGTGVGGAAMVDGHVLRGHIGRAGHLGHVSLDPWGAPDIVRTPGSLEDAMGDSTVAQRSGGRFATTRELVSAYRSGDAAATTVWLRSIDALAAGLASLINVLDPAVIVLGGGITEAGDALFGPLEPRLRKLEWQPAGACVRLERAKLGSRAGAFGAACHALRTREAARH